MTEKVTGMDMVKLQIGIAIGETLACAERTSRPHAATPSNAASMPRTPRRSPCPGRPDNAFQRPAAPAHGWTVPLTPMTTSRRITTHGREAHRRGGTLPRPWTECGALWRCSSSRASRLRSRFTDAYFAEPDFEAGRLDTHFIERMLPVAVK